MKLGSIPSLARRWGSARVGRAGVALAALLIGFGADRVLPARAQSITGLAGLPAPNSGATMLLESDQLVFDYDVDVISVVGNVKVYYGNYGLEADRLTYDQRTGRLVATGRVKVTEPSGNVLTADFFELDDNFRDGFIRSLRVATVDRTYFAAETGTRTDDRFTEFNRGVYTACEPCAERPDRPPVWQVRAARIVHDQTEKMVYFEDAAFEFFGIPLIYIPYFAGPDPTVRRKSGILAPIVRFSNTLGFGFGVPYFWAIAPNKDLTFSPIAYSKQGFLADAEWRHRLDNVTYSVRAAGIAQQDPSAFISGGKGTFAQRLWRGAVRTVGEVRINEQWTGGWDLTASSDRTFTRDYNIMHQPGSFNVSQLFLTGIHDRNFFDARGYYFQDTRDSAHPRDVQGHQPIVHPVVDYRRVWNDPYFGGEVEIDANLTSLSRELDDPFTVQGDPTTYYRGVAGTYTRVSTQVSWRDMILGPLGQQFIPFAYLRGDAFFLDNRSAAAQLTNAATATRGVAGIGLEWRWPWLITAGATSHIIEPIIQVVARPDAFGFSGILPNEDAQSLIFDDTNLLTWDKFSGWDRVETGTRVNVALRYFGDFGSSTLEAVVGQSYQVAGANPFAQPDIADTGSRSGLETPVSDYVASVTAATPLGSITARGRFDEETFRLERGEVTAFATYRRASASASVQYQRDEPDVNGNFRNTFLVVASGQVPLGEFWSASVGASYDVTSRLLTSNRFGLTYEDECFLFGVTYAEARNATGVTGRTVAARLSLRTIGDFGTNQTFR